MENKALQKINYGLYIVSAKNGGKFNGQIVNTVFQVTSEPPSVAICINKNNLTYGYIDKDKAFSVSVLEKETPMIYIGKFGFKSGKDIDKFVDTKYIIGKTGVPVVIDWSLAYFECEVISQTDAGTHAIFIGKVVNEGILQEDKEALTYEYYRSIKKGKSPKNAPTFAGNR
ncbi:MAG: flavin reductase [Candidatus Firestonebacteria bacterium RIFOXYC2_FULL_39_67]|nr:MAG: flavin reductase [Candidatus Firestonebacteria bacterium RIFOXYD2_FULL_39_29]OGF52622.1 MAG: flavin reductase [Candidatus Firestonebacteria bacterium RifOxyC12_full_39_7]OGF53967.1 MAG: flavin reductase [Candidatus Firestonebacteria bacterium RIFOXYC2_FULL_39_67]